MLSIQSDKQVRKSYLIRTLSELLEENSCIIAWAAVSPTTEGKLWAELLRKDRTIMAKLHIVLHSSKNKFKDIINPQNWLTHTLYVGNN